MVGDYMIYENTSSVFPNAIDDLIFFQDVDIPKKDILQTHREHINHHRYSEGTDYLQNSGIPHAYCSDLFNMFENRLYAVQKRMIDEPKESNITQYHQNDEPNGDHDEETLWIKTYEYGVVNVQPFDVVRFNYSISGNSAVLRWQEDGDYIAEFGSTEWAKTICVVKKGSVPKGQTDGFSVSTYTSKSSSITLSNLASGTYYARLFLISTGNKVNSSYKNIIKFTI